MFVFFFFLILKKDIEREYYAYCESYHIARGASEVILGLREVREALGSDVKPLTLDSFLIMPVQRVPRYLLMLQSMQRKAFSRDELLDKAVEVWFFFKKKNNFLAVLKRKSN